MPSTRTATQRTTAEWALRLRQYGFSVFPLDHPDAPKSKSSKPKDFGKVPVVEWKRYQTAPASEKQLKRWFSGTTPRNIGIATGSLSGIVVVDADNEAAVRWAESHLPPTPMRVRTMRGEHFYYRHPGQPVGNQTGARVRDGEGCRFDIRGDGGYVVAPGGHRHQGFTYEETVAWPDSPVELPLYDPMWFPTDLPAGSRRSGAGGAGADGVLQDGGRNSGLTSMAGSMRRRGFSADAIRAALLQHNRDRCEPPLPPEEVHAIAASIGKYPPGGDAPRHAGGGINGSRDEWIERETERLRVQREARQRLDAEDRGLLAIPQFLTLRERLSGPREPVSYRIAEWQPSKTRVLLSAQFKSGKTTLIGNLVRSLVDGDPFLGREVVSPVKGAVALIDTEMGTQLDHWLDVQNIRHTERVQVVSLRGKVGSLDLLSPQTRRQWAERLRDAGVRYLILDCLRPVLDALGLDEHKDAGRFLVGFDALLAEAGLEEALIVHHMGHINERARGDSRLRDWPDVEWRLMRRDSNPESARFVTAYGRDVEVPESSLSFDADSRRLSIGEGSRRDVAAVDALDDVLRVLGDRALSQRGIESACSAAGLQCGRNAIRAAIKLGENNGSLVAARGARGAILHRCAPARQSAPAVRQRTGDECASAPIARRTPTLLDTAPSGLAETAISGLSPKMATVAMHSLELGANAEAPADPTVAKRSQQGVVRSKP